jgi:histidine ammonia-lyase
MERVTAPPIVLDGNSLTLEQIVAIADDHATVTLADTARAAVQRARAVVDDVAARDEPSYGINTGFGNFA